jgi:hypothetical protein
MSTDLQTPFDAAVVMVTVVRDTFAQALRTGRFPIDLHAEDGAHVEVTALEVMPR